MGLLTIRQNDFPVICNKMDGVENVDPKVFLRTFLMRSKLPLTNGLIERSVGFCPEKWFPEIRILLSTICNQAKKQKYIQELIKDSLLMMMIWKVNMPYIGYIWQ